MVCNHLNVSSFVVFYCVIQRKVSYRPALSCFMLLTCNYSCINTCNIYLLWSFNSVKWFLLCYLLLLQNGKLNPSIHIAMNTHYWNSWIEALLTYKALSQALVTHRSNLNVALLLPWEKTVNECNVVLEQYHICMCANYSYLVDIYCYIEGIIPVSATGRIRPEFSKLISQAVLALEP